MGVFQRWKLLFNHLLALGNSWEQPGGGHGQCQAGLGLTTPSVVCRSRAVALETVKSPMWSDALIGASCVERVNVAKRDLGGA